MIDKINKPDDLEVYHASETKKDELQPTQMTYEEWMEATMPIGYRFNAMRWDSEHANNVLDRWSAPLVEAMCRSAWKGMMSSDPRDRKIATDQIRAIMPFHMAKKTEITVKDEGSVKTDLASYLMKLDNGKENKKEE